ncbi:MAG TPA: hypothetical protein VGC04_05605 [Cellulomonas sp.]
MSDDLVPEKQRPAAAFVAWGVGLCLMGGPLLLASVYAHFTAEPAWNDEHPGMALAVCGWIALGAGLVFLALGVYRLAQHADRAAGVRYAPAAPIFGPSNPRPAGGHKAPTT